MMLQGLRSATGLRRCLLGSSGRCLQASRLKSSTAEAAAAASQSMKSDFELPGLHTPKEFVPGEEVYSYISPSFKRTSVEELSPQWDSLGFQIRPVNGYVKFTWANGQWDVGTFVPAPYILLHINSGALHYGVSVFEGLKAFACKDGKVRIMNPKLNAARMQQGSKKLRMPEVPESLFVDAVTEAVKRNVEFVPPYGHRAALYIRPLLFASGHMLGLSPLAEEFTFMTTVMPVGGYFSSSGVEEGIDALVMEDHDRAAPKGTGAVKAAGNYAADLDPVHAAKAMGYGTTLYLDAKHRRYIEEFSVCNFVAITKDGTFVTPTAGSILESTTNKMIRQLAIDEGIKVECRPIDFDAEVESFSEVGMVGTAAVVVKVKSLTRGGKTFKTEGFETLARLRSKFTALQCGDHEDKHGWMHEACDVVTK